MKIRVKAQWRVVSTVKGIPFTQYEDIEAVHDVQPINQYYPDIMLQVIHDVQLREEVQMLAIARLRSDLEFKRMIGGTRWSVDVINTTIEKLEMV